MRPPTPPYLLHQLAGGGRVKLFCGACTWSRTYSVDAIMARLAVITPGGRYNQSITEVARHVGWPCPCCGRVRWATQPAKPPRGQFIENPTIPPRMPRG